MTITKSLTRKTRQMRKAITPTEMAKLHAFIWLLYEQNLILLPASFLIVMITWSETQPNTIIEKICIGERCKINLQ